MRILLSIFLLTFLFLSTDCRAQDVRFTQYYTLSSWLNPALSGQYDGKYRLSALYRDQWRGALENSLSSFGFNADTQFDLKKGRQFSDKVSVGLLLLNDRSRINDFNTNHIDLSGAFHKLLDKQKKQILSFGIKGCT